MNDLIREAEALSLPCFDLVPAQAGDVVVGHWGGRRCDLPEKFPPFVKALKSLQHLLSVDQKLFDELGLQGRGSFALAVITTAEDTERVDAMNVSSRSLADVEFKDSIPLTARPAKSLPPWDALSLYGGPATEAWLKSQNSQRWEYTDSQPEFYREFFNAQLPLLRDTPPVARIGGWHVTWPDDDFYIPREMRLMVWTFQDSEPWYEVFLTPLHNYRVHSRIT